MEMNTNNEQFQSGENRSKRSLLKPILIVVAIIVIISVVKVLLTDDSMGVSDMTFEDMTITIGEAVEQKPFCDAEWFNDGDSFVWMTFNDQSGNYYEIDFHLFDKGSSATIEAAYMNEVGFANLELPYLLDYLNSGDYDEFKSDLATYALLSAIFG